MTFFGTDCSEEPRTEKKFGLCDPENGTRAYSDSGNEATWVATVLNPESKSVTFTAIDNCISIPEGHRRCDGMLTTADTVCLVELKNVHKGWISDALEQLESTMGFLNANDDLTQYRYKKAFASNRRSPRFQEVDNERNLKCFREHGFRLDVNATITI